MGFFALDFLSLCVLVCSNGTAVMVNFLRTRRIAVSLHHTIHLEWRRGVRSLLMGMEK